MWDRLHEALLVELLRADLLDMDDCAINGSHVRALKRALIPLLDAIPRIRGRRGRPRHKPKRLYADRGYVRRRRRLLWARGIVSKIARRGAPHGSGLGKTRWVVERTFTWLHQFKRLRIRYEIRADLHQGLHQLACSIICLRRFRTSF
ncbi:IS5 family transposase ISBugl2 [Streptomyces sp. enrichment culture]